MKAWLKILLGISLSFMCVFSCIGYAAVSAPMRVFGTVKNAIPYGLFITNIETTDETNIDKNVVSHVEYTTTVDSDISRSRSTGTVVYRITVLNNTNLTYTYRGIYYQSNLSGYNGNVYISETPGRSYIGVECSLEDKSTEEKKVEPGRELTFTVTYTVGSGRPSGTDWRTLINYQFGINVDGEREALEVIENKFLNILNTPSTYEQLIDSLDNKFDGRQEWTSNYIGNVTGSSSDDSVAVNTLFAGQLQITVGDDEMDATVLIKHENLDGSTLTGDDYVAVNANNGGVFRGYGCEMTLYLTVDPLEASGRYVPVFAVVFTCDRDAEGNQISDWYRIGNTYAGSANVVTYDGGTGTGSFVTDNWIADSATHNIIDGYSFTIDGKSYELGAYSYSIDDGETIKSIVTRTDTNAVNTLQTLLDDAKRLIDDHDYAGSGIDLIQETYTRLAPYYTVDDDGKHTVAPTMTIAKLSPAIINLYTDVNNALVKIDELSKQQQG